MGSIGVDGRSADGPQSPHRSSMALCGSCNVRDGEIIRQQGTLADRGGGEFAGTFGCPVGGSVTGWPSAWEWNGSQPGHGAT